MAKRNYINNPDLFQAMVKYIERLKKAEEEGKPKPRIPDYIGEAIWKIAEGLGRRPNFSSYSFLDEMKSDGIENCIQYLHNFNPEKSQNPFAYFTRIIWFAFLRRIQKEQKQQYIKYKLSLQSTGDVFSSGESSSSIKTDHTAAHHEKMAQLAEKFEPAPKAPKKQGIEKFTDEGK